MVVFEKKHDDRYTAQDTESGKTATIIAYESWLFGRVRRFYRIEMGGTTKDMQIRTLRDAKKSARQLLK